MKKIIAFIFLALCCITVLTACEDNNTNNGEQCGIVDPSCN